MRAGAMTGKCTNFMGFSSSIRPADLWLATNGPSSLQALHRAIGSKLFSDTAVQDSDLAGTIAGVPEPGRETFRTLDEVRNCALYLVDTDGLIAGWYRGAEDLYGYPAPTVLGWHTSKLFGNSDEAETRRSVDAELARAAAERHAGSEGWQCDSEGRRFWANSITLALRDDEGVLRGYARAVRDFSERHELDVRLTLQRNEQSDLPAASASVGTIHGTDRGKDGQGWEVNDAFLELVGYSREDVAAGRLDWAELTPPEYRLADELGHEEALRFGVNVPLEKELLHKSGHRIKILAATAVLRLVPFEWITFMRRLSAPLQSEEETEDPDDKRKPGEFTEIVGESAALRRMQREIEMVAPTDTTVLILGETGTGKELVARAIHGRSDRRNMPFVTLNCAAIPKGLLESELFGYERGAFTGALQQKIGRFEMAHKGTLFLDEVGDIPIDLQPKLLRALQEKSFERLGGKRTILIDVRLVAATNRDLTQMMGDKLFRSDLYYRLRVFPITTPALRNRPGDIPLLAHFFMKKYGRKMGKELETIPAETMAAMMSWPWPGNVRELENFIERSVILSRGPGLRAPLSEIRGGVPPTAGAATLEQVEREHIIRIFRECNGVVTATANHLGLHRTTLNAMMRKLGISRKDLTS